MNEKIDHDDEPFFEKFDRLGSKLESMTVDQVKQRIGFKEGQRITIDQFIKSMSEGESNE